MIDKSGEYWHLYFNEICADDPGEILALVEKLLAEVALMGDQWLMRVAPTIDRNTNFETGERKACVYCRFSSKPPIFDTNQPKMFGFGKS